jgi:hypothetical protein
MFGTERETGFIQTGVTKLRYMYTFPRYQFYGADELNCLPSSQ